MKEAERRCVQSGCPASGRGGRKRIWPGVVLILLVAAEEWPLREESAVVGRDCMDPSEQVGDLGDSGCIPCASCWTEFADPFDVSLAIAPFPFTVAEVSVVAIVGVSVPLEVREGLYGLGDRVRILGKRVDLEL